MFLLLLMGLGAASVKAQVRIGGNGAPSAAAVLDLNATDATTAGTKGLALPRVSLASTTDLLGNATILTGMLVYNTNATLGSGIYFWNGSRWVLTSLPAATPADSGRTIVYTPKGWILERVFEWKNLDFVLNATWTANTYMNRTVSGISYGLCIWWDAGTGISGIASTELGNLTMYNATTFTIPAGVTIGVRCLGSM